MNAYTPNLVPVETSPLVEFWNEILAPKLITYRHILVDGLSRHSAQILPALHINQGDHILDVGCGFGDTAVTLSKLAGASGSVVGIDCCPAFLDYAVLRAKENAADNVRFVSGDVETGVYEGQFDFVFARFGTMFFVNPVAGLRAMRNSMKPGGRMAHIVWRKRADNPWLCAASEVVQSILPKPGEDARTCGPGPFSMSDEETTRMQMQSAGYTDIAFQQIDAKVMVGRTIEEAIAFQLAIGPAGETFREAGALGEERRSDVEAALTKLFQTVETNAEGLWMDSSSWLITAENPVTE